MKRLVELDALRGIATLSVLIYHYFYRYNEKFGYDNLFVKWADLGQFGVHLFFIISGFVIYWTFERIKSKREFIVSRFSRLFPGYWVACTLSTLVMLCLPLPNKSISLVQYLVNMTMLHEFFGITAIDGVYWTLTRELVFYIWMFVLYSLNWLRWAGFILFPCVILSIFETHHLILYPYPVVLLLNLKLVPFFISGICFYKLYQKGSFKGPDFYLLLLNLVCLIGVYSLVHFVIFAFLHLVFYLSITSKLSLLVKKPFLFLGDISYSFYLIHQQIGFVIIYYLLKFHAPIFLAILAATAISILTAYFSATYVEKPALKRLRAVLSKN